MDTLDAYELVKRRMVDGRTIHDDHVRDLLAEIERLRNQLANPMNGMYGPWSPISVNARTASEGK